MKAMVVFRLDVTRWDRQAPLETVWFILTPLAAAWVKWAA